MDSIVTSINRSRTGSSARTIPRIKPIATPMLKPATVLISVSRVATSSDPSSKAPQNARAIALGIASELL